MHQDTYKRGVSTPKVDQTEKTIFLEINVTWESTEVCQIS